MRQDYLFPELSEPSKQLLAAKEEFAGGDLAARGAIYTRREVVDFILDLAGYNPTASILDQCVLEPSFGDADFLEPITERLLQVVESKQLGHDEAAKKLCQCVRGVELSRASLQTTREKLHRKLLDFGFTERQASAILDAWLICDDFLLHDFTQTFDFVIGNPPYIRQESVPTTLLFEYKKRYKTIYDRADLYVPFIERGLTLLKQRGTLGFICADRWTKNRYGAPLRRFVSQGFHLKFYVDMYGTDAFSSEVTAYPAITIIERSKTRATRIAKSPNTISAASLRTLADTLNSPKLGKSSGIHLTRVVAEDAPWLLDCPKTLSLVRRLEDEYMPLETCGCRVGIGVATGADKVFIGDQESLDVEDECKLPLIMTRDIDSGTIEWRGKLVLNPFNEDGTLKALEQYPKMHAYFSFHETHLKKRHVAKKNPTRWYRTIDRITPSLTKTPKLLIPDIKGNSHVVYDDGRFYPHHNLYFITATDWNLLALKHVLLSGIATLFVSTYTTKMRGGYYRFQAQYIRRICVPRWDSLSRSLKTRLTNAGKANAGQQQLDLVGELYGLDDAELAILQSMNLRGATNGN
ncbi:MAG: Eco57I restriction-modification methylase domain-containing protein [bacterium]|nr:Eco57I restriction-modification methylase domain-containing protein [bacterium]